MLEIIQTIVNEGFVKEGADDFKITPDMKIAALGIDSLESIEFLLELENELGITIPNEVMEDVTTVQDLIDKVIVIK